VEYSIGEECDDGNVRDSDGCNMQCKKEDVFHCTGALGDRSRISPYSKLDRRCQGQVDFPPGQVTFHSHLLDGWKDGWERAANFINKKKLKKACPGQANLRCCLSKGKAGISVFASPACCIGIVLMKAQTLISSAGVTLGG